MAKFGKWVGGGLGWAVGGPIGAIVGFVVGSLIDNTSTGLQVGPGTGYSGRTTTGGYVMSLLVLVSAVMKADGSVKKSELDYVKNLWFKILKNPLPRKLSGCCATCSNKLFR